MKPTPFNYLLAAAALMLTACETTTPMLDAQFGQSVTAARATQVIDPSASMDQKPVDGLDGRAARSAMIRYQESFKTPQGSFDASNIGGTFAGSSSGQ